MKRDMQAAAAAGDITTIIRHLTSVSALTPTDFIRKTVGNFMFMYYIYIDKFHVRPADIDDWIDGLLYLDAKSYIEKRAQEELEQQRSKKNG